MGLPSPEVSSARSSVDKENNYVEENFDQLITWTSSVATVRTHGFESLPQRAHAATMSSSIM